MPQTGPTAIIAASLALSACGGPQPTDQAEGDAVKQRHRVILAEMSPVCSGQGVAGAGRYDPNRDGIKPIVILSVYADGTGVTNPWSFELPGEWWPSSVANTELVACVGDPHSLLRPIPERSYEETCTYVDPISRAPLFYLTRQGFVLDVKVREALSGNLVATTVVEGAGPPPCPGQTSGTRGRHTTVGDNVSVDQVIQWLRPLAQGDS
jgi:hypothetical protein